LYGPTVRDGTCPGRLAARTKRVPANRSKPNRTVFFRRIVYERDAGAIVAANTSSPKSVHVRVVIVFPGVAQEVGEDIGVCVSYPPNMTTALRSASYAMP
jgi:hypothetical protein